MTLLSSLGAAPNIVVVGASGGIGGAICATRGARLPGATIHAFSRRQIEFSAANITSGMLDITDEPSIRLAAAKSASTAPIDVVLVATGMLHRKPDVCPEKSMRELGLDSMTELFTINAIGPSIVGKHFLPRLRKGIRRIVGSHRKHH